MSKILIIEDETDQLEILEQLLELRHYQIERAFNGVDGIAQAMNCKPDLIIVDLLLVAVGDSLDGFDVIRAIRSAPRTSTVGIIAYTSNYTTERHEILALGAGADVYVRKDVHFAVLEANISALLRRIAWHSEQSDSEVE